VSDTPEIPYHHQLKNRFRGYFPVIIDVETAGFDAKKDVYFKSQYEDGSKILKALDAGEMFLEFQPEISFSTGETLSFEALIRWRKDGEIIYPSDFLPLIKTSSASSNIALFTIKEALLARKMWLENGISAKVRVNLSVKKLFTEEFWHKFKALCAKDDDAKRC